MYDFIKTRLKDLGKTQKELAEFLRVAPPHLSAIFKGIRRIQPEEIAPMARFLQFDTVKFIEYISTQQGAHELINTAPIKSIYKIGYVQAGKFNEACQLPESEWETVPFAANDDYKTAHLFALGVRGDSMNLTFPAERTTLICCPLSDWLTINPETSLEGKYIIAYCRRPDGTCEATVKKYTKIDDQTIILVAESSNPEIKPIILRPDNNQYEIAAVVIGDMRVY